MKKNENGSNAAIEALIDANPALLSASVVKEAADKIAKQKQEQAVNDAESALRTINREVESNVARLRQLRASEKTLLKRLAAQNKAAVEFAKNGDINALNAALSQARNID